MPRVLSFDLSVKTGSQSTETPVRCCINGHTIELDDATGGTGPNEVLSGSVRIMSFVHTLTLVGPDEGQWQVDGIEVKFHCDGLEPYLVRFGEVTLDQETEVSIWAEPQSSVFYV